MQLANAVCIVTGSATGIGAACARELSSKGCRVAINYSTNEQDAMAVASDCETLGAETMVVKANVAEDADCRNMADAVAKRWGRIDCLVNNAGITKFALDHRNLDSLTADDFSRLYAVNVIGTFQMIRAVAPAMTKQGAGGIVNISSIAAVVGIGSSVAYAASKGALSTMTLSLARALAPEIRVNAVCPGFVDTERWQRAFGPGFYAMAKARSEQSAPLRKVASPQSVANAVVWLLEGAELVTGESILVDGGSHLGYAAAKAR